MLQLLLWGAWQSRREGPRQRLLLLHLLLLLLLRGCPRHHSRQQQLRQPGVAALLAAGTRSKQVGDQSIKVVPARRRRLACRGPSLVRRWRGLRCAAGEGGTRDSGRGDDGLQLLLALLLLLLAACTGLHRGMRRACRCCLRRRAWREAGRQPRRGGHQQALDAQLWRQQARQGRQLQQARGWRGRHACHAQQQGQIVLHAVGGTAT